MSEDVRRLVGRNVERLRIAADLSQAELAERMGVDRAYVSGLAAIMHGVAHFSDLIERALAVRPAGSV
jgi:transcriptional regulator with XRE-family HTH domain